ncbi:hypothetical protein R6Q59_010674 [Mikania micrantha]
MAMCYCGRLATVRTFWTDQNPGRRFYSCPNEASRCRGFLGWLDPPMCPRATVIIPGLLRSKNKLKDEVKQLKATIGKKNFIIFFFIAHLLEGFLVGQMVDAHVQQGFLVGQMVDALVHEGFLMVDALVHEGFLMVDALVHQLHSLQIHCKPLHSIHNIKPMDSPQNYNDEVLDREFWGSILGYQNYGYLSKLHVKGWVTRLMRFRWKEITKNRRPEQLFPWTIMPPQFYDILCETPNHGALPFCIGMKKEYPALWDVDTVYIPIVIEDIHWLLLRVDMRTLEMYVNFTENCDDGVCQTTCIHRLFYSIITRFETLFKSFLDNILFWENCRRDVIPKIKIFGTEVWPQYNGPVGSNSGVFVCMLM